MPKKPFYLVKSSWWMRLFWPSLVWKGNPEQRTVYLTFDDGPDPVATPFVLDLLAKHEVQATFFCLGEQVQLNPALYQRILDEGHGTGNHTHRHPNGWKTKTSFYIDDVREASQHIHSHLFRPPYGRIKKSQVRHLKKAMGREDVKIIMWSVLSGDFDTTRSAESCYRVVRKHARAGSIIVFHDSQKAFPNLSESLSPSIEYLKEKGYRFGVL
jgi:peptidoglycan/xylan/chitin deacetylase (PgdA/CDA1 family)